MAFHEPDKVPQKCQVHTATMTLQEYADVLDKYSETGNKLKLQGKSLEQAKSDWEKTKHTIPIGMVSHKFTKETDSSLDLYCRLLWRRDILIIPRTVQMRSLILEKVNGNLLPLKCTQNQSRGVLGKENSRSDYYIDVYNSHRYITMRNNFFLGIYLQC
jgi:hypothetical protein